SSAERFGLTEGVLGSFEIAEPAPHFTQLHEPGRRVRAAHTNELGAGADDLLLGSRPLTSTLQGPRPMHPAQAGKQRERVLLRPPGRRVGPLRRPPVVTERLAGADQAAV